MPNLLNSIPFFRPKRNTFPGLSNEHRTSSDVFRLAVNKVIECYPDDVYRLRTELFARVSPLVAPIMHRFDVRTYWFFVPTRIIWDDFETFMASKINVPGDVELAAPKITFTGNGFVNLAPKTLGNYMRCNIGLSPEDQSVINETFINKANALHPNGLVVSQLPFRAYQKIYNDWLLPASVAQPNPELRDSNDIILSVLPGYTGEDEEQKAALELTRIRYRSWQQDYFTSCLPDPQRGPEVMAFDGGDLGTITGSGTTSVNVGLQNVDYNYRVNGVSYKSLEEAIVSQYQYFGFESSDLASAYVNVHASDLRAAHDAIIRNPIRDNSVGTVMAKVPINNVDYPVDLYTKIPSHTGTVQNSQIAAGLRVGGTASGVSVEELRIRMQMQAYLERENIANGNGAGRYTQTLYAHWGVKGKDGRLQRAEFIGASKAPVMINEVSQLSEPTETNPLGQMAGQGVSSTRGKGFKFRAPEHGYIIGLFCITPRSAYMQGLPKYWTKFDRLDFYFPEFAHVGEEPVYYRELLNNGFNGNQIFGYNLRNLDLKMDYDTASGDMCGSLAHWHAARAFATPASAAAVPKLTKTFLCPASSDVDDIDRIFPVQNTAFETTNADHFIIDIFNHTVGSRLMPKYSTPRIGM